MPRRLSRTLLRAAWLPLLGLLMAAVAFGAVGDGPTPARATPVSQYCTYLSQTGAMTPTGTATVADAIALPDDNKFIQMDYTPGSSVTLNCSIAPSKDGTAAPDLRVDTYDEPFTAIARIAVSMDNVTYYDLGDQADSAKYDATHFGKDWDLDGIAALVGVPGPFPYVRVTQSNQCSPAWDGAAGPGDCGDPDYPDLAFDLDAIVDLAPAAPPANAEVAFFKNLDGGYVHSTTATLSVVGGAINTTVAATDISLYGSPNPVPGPWTKLSVPAGSYTVGENVPSGQAFIAGRCVIVNGSPLDEIDIDPGTTGNQYFWGNSTVIAAGGLNGGPENGPSARIFDAPDAIGPASGTISVGAGDIVYCVAYNETLPSDVTPPTITPVVDGTLGSNGWYISDVEVSWIITDPDSQVTSTTGCETVLLTNETLGVTLTCEATSAGGTDSESVTIKIDKTPPIAVLTPTGTLGDNGWYVSDVTITTTGTETISNPITCSPDQYQTTDTAAATFNGSCTNDAGLTGHAPALTIKRDATKPIAEIISVTGPSGPVDDDDDDDDDYDGRIDHLVAAGDEFEATSADVVGTGGPHGSPGDDDDYEFGTWSNGPITITFTCTDALSGAIDGPFVVVLTGDFNDFYTGNGGCKDKAGNIADPVTTEGKILIDNTPPEVQATAWNRVTEYLAPKYWTPYTAGTWTKYDVTIFFTCVDTGAGIAKESMVIEDRSVLNEVEDYTVHTRILRCIDKAGNVAPRASFGPINIDQTKPVVTGGPTTSPNSKGWWKTDVTVNFACTDVASGFGGPAPMQSITIVTDGANQKAKSTLNCTDLAGNVGNEKTVSNINIDRVAPTCTVGFSPSSVGTLNGMLKTINALININDALSGGDSSATKLLSISNGTIGTDIVDWNIGGNDTSGRLRATAGSPYGFGYEVADKAGNTGACNGSVTR